MTGPDPKRGLIIKLAEVLGEVGTVEARGKHQFLGTKYVTEDDLLNAVREKLSSRNVVLLPMLEDVDFRDVKTPKGKDTTITQVHVAYQFIDGDSGEREVCRWAGQGEDPGSQGINKANTSALRTFLLKAFMVSSGEEESPPPPRSDGQTVLTSDQYDAILAAYAEAGSDPNVLGGILDSQKVPADINGTELSVGQRVKLLTALQAISVQKSLQALKP